MEEDIGKVKAASDDKIYFNNSSDSDNDSLPDIECKICNKSFCEVRAYEQHIHSKKHRNNLMKQNIKKKSEGCVDPEGDDEKDSEFQELKCPECSLTFDGIKPYISHMKGSNHAKTVKSLSLKEELKGVLQDSDNNTADDEDSLIPRPLARCTLCEKEFSGYENFKQHLNSVIHRRKLKDQKILQHLKEQNQGTEDDEEFYKRCETCDKSFSGLQPYNVHMQSSVHQKALKKVEAEKALEGLFTRDETNTKLICNECKNPFGDPFSFKLHIDNNSHRKYEMKRKIMEFVNSNPDIVLAKTYTSGSEVNYKVGDYILLCAVCHMSFTGPESAKAHLDSKKHKKVKEDKEKVKLIMQSQNSTKATNLSVKPTENGIAGLSQDNKHEPQLMQKATATKSVNSSSAGNNPADDNDDFELI